MYITIKIAYNNIYLNKARIKSAVCGVLFVGL